MHTNIVETKTVFYIVMKTWLVLVIRQLFPVLRAQKFRRQEQDLAN